MTIFVTSKGEFWFLARRYDDGTVERFGQPYTSLRAALKVAARMNARRAA